MNTLKTNNKELISEVKESYEKYLDNLVELINSYGYKSALEIFCLFNELNKHYIDISALEVLLSHHFCYPALEHPKTSGIQVLLHGGVCRHRSNMLHDLYGKIGIESAVLVGRSETILKIHYGNTHNKQLSDAIFVQKMLEKVSRGININLFKSELKRRKITIQNVDINDSFCDVDKVPSNHMIVLAGDDKANFLDPMLNQIYQKNPEDEITLRSCMGNYFFISIKECQKQWISSIMKVDSQWILKDQKAYNKIMQKESASENESMRAIRDIYSYLNSHSKSINEFVNDNAETVESMKQKCLSLRQY